MQPRPTSTFTQSISWAESEAAFVLEDYQWYIDDSGKLTLGPGVTVKLPASADMAVRTNLEAKGKREDLSSLHQYTTAPTAATAVDPLLMIPSAVTGTPS